MLDSYDGVCCCDRNVGYDCGFKDVVFLSSYRCDVQCITLERSDKPRKVPSWKFHHQVPIRRIP